MYEWINELISQLMNEEWMHKSVLAILAIREKRTLQKYWALNPWYAIIQGYKSRKNLYLLHYCYTWPGESRVGPE